MKFKVKSLIEKKEASIDPDRLDQALKLTTQFEGLTKYYSLEEIVVLWSGYSEDFCAGWLEPHDHEIEYVFGVELELVDDE